MSSNQKKQTKPEWNCVKIVSMNLCTVFMGSPEFALPILQMLAEKTQVVGVVTQPDRPTGRGKVLAPPPVKVLAQSLGLEIIQPNRLKEPEAQERLAVWKPDMIVVAAFGQILRQNVLDLPQYGCINVHASLLPRWRGAAPIQAAILAGDAVSGVSIMKMDAGIDTGDILAQARLTISAEDTAETLGGKLSVLGARLLLETLPGYLEGVIRPVAQNAELFTYVGMLKKEDGKLDFTKSAVELERAIRAYQPWPGAYFYYENEPVKVYQASIQGDCELGIGQYGASDGYPVIGTAHGGLVLRSLQPAGKRIMAGDVFLRGARHWLGQD